MYLLLEVDFDHYFYLISIIFGRKPTFFQSGRQESFFFHCNHQRKIFGEGKKSRLEFEILTYLGIEKNDIR